MAIGSASPLTVLAGKKAREWLNTEGLRPERIHTIAGASGGAKWLVLSQMDRVLTSQLLPRFNHEVQLVGSSIGAWRMTAFALPNPTQAIERLEKAYMEQEFSRDVTPAEVTQKSRRLATYLVDGNARSVVEHPLLRLHIVVAKARGLSRARGRAGQLAGLTLAAASNALHRRLIGLHFQRVIIGDERARPAFQFTPRLGDVYAPLSEENLEDAVLASGAIPLVLEGVIDIHGAPPGVYRDGGVTDYHFADALSSEQGMTFMTHFYPHLIPGWFDKPWKRRHAAPEKLSRTLIIAPSKAFIDALPYGKIPDRHDFVKLDRSEREKYWNQVVSECERLADALAEHLERDTLGSVARPI